MIIPSTCRPTATYRVLAWVCVAFFGFMLFIVTTQWRAGTLKPGDAWACLAFFPLMGWGCAWFVNEAMARYAWDDDRLIRRDLFGEKSVSWAEINQYKIRRLLGDFTYILYDCHGIRLTIDFQLLAGEACPLYAVIQEKLAKIIKEAYGEKNPAAAQTLVIKTFGFKTQSLTLEKDHLVHCKWSTRGSIPYAQIKYVFIMISQNGSRAGNIFSDGVSDLFSISSTAKDFDRIIYQLKSRLPHAKWIEPGTPLDAEDVRVIIRRDIGRINKDLKERNWIGLCMVPVMIYIAAYGKSAGTSNQGIPFNFVIVAIVIFFFLFDLTKLRKMRKTMAKQLNELEAQKSGN
jgi:hypothetical protein